MTQNQGPPPYWIDPDSPGIYFPDVENALVEPDGLLAVGGDLSSERLLYAYRNGIFPWYGPDQPILWWSPDPRLVLFPEDLRISRSLAKTLKKHPFTVTFDTAFEQVIAACAEPRPGQAGTWITPEMQAAYVRMHELGHAHSVECWQAGELAGGLYGLALGRVFFGESMFTRITDASKVGFVTLVQMLQRRGYRLIDCQVRTGHLESLGAALIPRREFTRILDRETWQTDNSPWVLENPAG
ncbi:MAG: leucyl/phenylalanyl-tRNA--protein transferase [Thiohalobacterales bacterium]|nr:leucyl/phenylalanyl-tRNA--protein transferase [Thiohalobacterales bacterium]